MAANNNLIVNAVNLNGIKDPVEFAKYLDRMAQMRRRVFHDGRWWYDPQELKRELKL